MAYATRAGPHPAQAVVAAHTKEEIPGVSGLLSRGGTICCRFARQPHRLVARTLPGHHSGWIALHTGVAGSADVILIPEIPFTMQKSYEKIRERQGASFLNYCRR